MKPIVIRILSSCFALILGTGSLLADPSNPPGTGSGNVDPSDILSFTIKRPSLVKLHGASSKSVFYGQTWEKGVATPLRQSDGTVTLRAEFTATAGKAQYCRVICEYPTGETAKGPVVGTQIWDFDFKPEIVSNGYSLPHRISVIDEGSGQILATREVVFGDISTPKSFGGHTDPYPKDDSFDYAKKSCNACTNEQAGDEVIIVPCEGANCAPGTSMTEATSKRPVRVTYDAGGDAGGRSQTKMEYAPSDLSASGSVTPNDLSFMASDSATVQMNSTNQYPSSIITAAGTTAVSSITNGFKVTFTPTGSTTVASETRFVRWVDGSKYCLRVLEKRYGGPGHSGGPGGSGSIVETRYVQEPGANGDTWTVYHGGDHGSGDLSSLPAPTSNDNLFMRKSVVVTDTLPVNDTQTITVYEDKTSDSNTWVEMSKRVHTYGDYSWGTPIIKCVHDPSGKNLSENWIYLDNVKANQLKGARSYHYYRWGGVSHYRKFEQSTGRIASSRKRYADTYDYAYYTYLSETRVKIVRKIGTTSVSQTYVSRDSGGNQITIERSVALNDVYGKVGALKTVITKNGESLSGGLPTPGSNQISSIVNEDGTKTTFSYAASGSNFEVTTLSGSAALTAGSKSVATYDPMGNRIDEEVWTLDEGGTAGSSLLLMTRYQENLDDLGRPQTFRTDFADGAADQSRTMEYSCCGIRESTDIYGITTEYHYDHLRRLETTKSRGLINATQREGLTTRSILIPAADLAATNGHYTIRGVTIPTTAICQSASVRNLFGETTSTLQASPQHHSETFANQLATLEETTYSYTYGATTTSTTVNAPATGAQTTVSHPDGRTKSTSGAGVQVPMTYEYGATLAGVTKSNGAVYGSKAIADNGTEWSASLVNFLGQPVQAYVADGSESLQFYNSSGQLVRAQDPDGVVTHYGYNSEGQRVYSALDLDTTSTTGIDFAVDRISWSETDYTDTSGATGVGIGSETTSKVFEGSAATLGTASTTMIRRNKLTGFLSVTLPQGKTALKETTTTVLGTAGNWTVTTEKANGLKIKQDYQAGWLNYTQTLDGTTQVTKQTNGYDAYKRVNLVTDDRTGGVARGYYFSGAVRFTTINQGAGTGDDITTSYEYDTAGRATLIDRPDTGSPSLHNQTYTNYYDTGQTKAVWGHQTYGKVYEYDSQGRMTKLHTYKSDFFASGTPPASAGASATTTWNYDTQRGWLISKRDDDNKGADYTYTDAGRLKTRTWARALAGQKSRVKTTYTYKSTSPSELEQVTYDYDDDLTPDLQYVYDRLGRVTEVKRRVGNNSASFLTHAEYAYTAGDFVLNEELSHRDTDGNGTLETTFDLDRKYDSLLRPSGWEFRKGTTLDHSTGYGYDSIGRLQKVDPTYPVPTSADHTYAYESNSYGLINTVTNPGHTVDNTWESYRNHLDRKQNIVSGSDVSSYDYTVNDIGQRTQNDMAGTAFDNVTRTYQPRYFNYSYDEHGQVDSLSVRDINDDPEEMEPFERAYAYDGIGNRTASRNNESVISANDGRTNYVSNSLNEYTSFTTDPTLPSEVTITPSYDDDGNMTAGLVPAQPGSNATLVWDAENRLVEVTVGTTTTTYEYDYLGRRMSKKVGSATAIQYLYDGWNLIAEYTGTSLERTYVWGLDLSGSMQGAGGVGGLLSVDDQSAVYYPTYDGNGNITEYLNSSGGVVAHYEYDPFGNIGVSDGSKKDDFLHRFSSKPLDDETGLYYYGYRYCAPSEAWHLLRGASPRRKLLKGGSREGQGLATRFVASLAGVKERRKRMNDTTEA